jgi:hypothetical protein
MLSRYLFRKRGFGRMKRNGVSISHRRTLEQEFLVQTPKDIALGGDRVWRVLQRRSRARQHQEGEANMK